MCDGSGVSSSGRMVGTTSDSSLHTLFSTGCRRYLLCRHLIKRGTIAAGGDVQCSEADLERFVEVTSMMVMLTIVFAMVLMMLAVMLKIVMAA